MTRGEKFRAAVRLLAEFVRETGNEEDSGFSAAECGSVLVVIGKGEARDDLADLVAAWDGEPQQLPVYDS